MGIDYSKLSRAVNLSYKKLKTPRENRFKFIKESVGKHYGDGGTDYPVPINLIRLAESIYTRLLVSSNPKVTISTFKPRLKMSCYDYEIALNHLIGEIKLKKKLRRLVTDAMYGIGIMKVGIAAGRSVFIDEVKYELGQPYAEPCDLDYMVIDMSARSWDDVQYIGDIGRVDYEWALTTFGEDKKEILKPDKTISYSKGERDTESISKGRLNAKEKEDMSYREMCDILSLYLPIEKKIVTYGWSENGCSREPLHEEDYNGPEEGPYIPLYFNEVSGNIMPLPPVALWYDIHELANELYRKLGRQARRQKDVLAGDPKARKDLEKVKESSDGDIVTMLQPDKMQALTYGGPNQGTFAFFLNSLQQMNKISGNIDTLGGLGASTGTATQDKLIMGTATQQVQDMQDMVEEATARICRSLAWYLFYDPFIQIPAVKRIPGIPASIEVTITKDMLEGDFMDYNYAIKPYSLQEETPAAKFNTLTGIFTQLIMPLAPQMEAQGLTVDFQELMDLIEKFKNLPEISDILISSQNMNKDSKPISKPFGTPPAKESGYVKKNDVQNDLEKQTNKIVNSFVGV